MMPVQDMRRNIPALRRKPDHPVFLNHNQPIALQAANRHRHCRRRYLQPTGQRSRDYNFTLAFRFGDGF